MINVFNRKGTKESETLYNINVPRAEVNVPDFLFSQFFSLSLQTNKTIHRGLLSGHLIAGKTREEFEKHLLNELDGDFCTLFREGDLCCFVKQKSSYVVMKNDDYAQGRIIVDLYTFNEEYVKRFHKLVKQYLVEKTSNSIFMLAAGEAGLEFTNVGEIDSPLMRENYEQDILKSFDYMVDNMLSKDNHGRLVILSGPPGTGKTFFIRGLVDKLSKSSMCVIIPANLILELDGPKVVPVLLQYNRGGQSYDEALDKWVNKPPKPIVFICEDCDNFLVPREGADSSLISSLLNYTSGIMGDLLNIRFITTTNASHLKVDRALMRPGRLLSHTLIEELSPEKANEVYQRLTEGKGKKVFTKEMSLASVYAEANNVEIYDPLLKEEKKHKLGFN